MNNLTGEMVMIQQSGNDVPNKYLIDCNGEYYVPEEYEQVVHNKPGILTWSPLKFSLFFSEAQKNGRTIFGFDLGKVLKGKTLANMNVLDFYDAHHQLIPEEWKVKKVLFPGSMYYHRSGEIYVRGLFLDHRGWRWDDFSWESEFTEEFAVLIINEAV